MSKTLPGSWISGAYAESRACATFVLATMLVLAAAARPANAQGQFAYVANFDNQSTISGFAINENTGALTPVPGSPFKNAGAPLSVAVDPTGRFVYAIGGEAVEGYAINQGTGSLSPVPGSPYSDPTGPEGIAIDPTGRFVYSANFVSGNVGGYRINSSTGALTKIPGSPFAAGAGAYAVVVDPTARFLYASNEVAGNISEYAINAATGALTPISGSPVASAQNTLSIAVDPLDRYLYETNQNGTVLVYQVNPATGALSGVVGSPFAAGEGPISVAADPTGHFVYVVNGGPGTPGSATISAYTINGPFSGAQILQPLGSPTAAGNQSGFVTVDPTGTFAYVANFADGTVGVYAIHGGKLTPVPGSPFASGPGPQWIAISPPYRRTHPVYSSVQIPPPQFFAFGGSLSPKAINNKGEVVGSVAFSESGSERFGFGFLYSGGTTIPVGNTDFSTASSINDKTQVVGQTPLTLPGPFAPPQQAFVYSNGTLTDLDNVKGRQSAASGINNAGEVTGTLSTGVCVPPFCPHPVGLGDTHAFIDTGHGLTDLGTLGGNFSAGSGINNLEEIVGVSNLTSNGPGHLFLYYHGQMYDLGAPAGLNPQGMAINDLGEIIGSSSQGGFVWISGALEYIPPMQGGTASVPGGINNLGIVVGSSDVGGQTHAFLYNIGALTGSLTDLNNAVAPTLPLLTSAAGINDSGQIVVTSLTGQIYVLTPIR